MKAEITDVYLRDGLQDEPVVVPTEQKLAVAEQLREAGVRRIEAGSFVNPKKVPQMADSADLFARLPRQPGVVYSALTLNERGVQRAVAAGADEITLVISASEAHSTANAGRSVDEALENLAGVVEAFPDTRFTAGIATAFRCPFEGTIDPQHVIRVVRGFTAMGVRAIGLADTLGNTPTQELLDSFLTIRDAEPDAEYSLHLHNAIGQALDTAVAAAHQGVTKFDAALAGYGGCPFAPGAHGNLATEELTAHFSRHGIETGINQQALSQAAETARSAVADGQRIIASPTTERK